MTEQSGRALPPKGQQIRQQGGAASPPALWDPLVRISHWGIAVVVLANALFTKGGGWLHVSIGWAGLTLLLLRLIWGVFGPWEAQFAAFPPNPVAALRHLIALVAGRPRHYVSHNPAGAMMAYALWLCLAVVTFSGLVMTDFATPLDQILREDVVANGDWTTLAKPDRDDKREGAFEVVEEVHELAANLMLFLAFVHVVGVFVEGRALRRNLVAPMLFGSTRRKRRS